MARKRISSKAASDIANDRMSRLLDLSIRAVRNGDEERARRYASIAKRIGQKTRTPMPKDVDICKGCGIPMDVGVNCRVRIGDGRVRITCLGCGSIRRMPYTREQRE